MRSVSIRWRLTFWYSAVLALLLTVFGALVYGMIRQYLLEQTDAEVTAEMLEYHREVKNAAEIGALQSQLKSFFRVHEEYHFELLTPDGKRLIATKGLGDHSLVNASEADEHGLNLTTRQIEQLGRYRVANQIVQGPDGPLRIAIAIPFAPTERLLDRCLLILLSAGSVVLLGATFGGAFMARRALSPVESIRASADRITAEHLSQRIPMMNADDELGKLATTFNQMLERLDASFQEMRRFTGDAAHELRTPITVLRSGLEVALRKARSAEEYREALEGALDDVVRLCRLSEQLLILAREDAGSHKEQRTPVRVDELIQSSVESIQPIADEKGIQIRVGELSDLPISGDPNRLQRLWINLLENAVKYTPPGGAVDVTGESTERSLVFIVADSGSGIPESQLDRVFDRFYRVDESRTGSTGGTGLGLTICRSIVESHGGSIEIESEPGSGTRVLVTFPRPAHSPLSLTIA
ncbi:MAG: heavy metal sensor histidine kinase [Planctomycetaceae bacterium]